MCIITTHSDDEYIVPMQGPCMDGHAWPVNDNYWYFQNMQQIGTKCSPTLTAKMHNQSPSRSKNMFFEGARIWHS